MKVVIGVDGSEHSLAAVRLAGRLLDPLKDTVVLYYSVPTAALEDLRPKSTSLYNRAREAFAEAVFREARGALPAGFRAACVTEHSKQRPPKGLVTTAQARGADLIVVGARGTGRLQRILLGSVSRAVAHACQVPTLVVRSPSPELIDGPLRVLIACAGPEAGEGVSALLQKLTWPSSSQAKILHVIESLFAGEIPQWLIDQARSQDVELQAKAWVLQHEKDTEEAKQHMKEYGDSLPETLNPVEVVVAEGNPTEQILEQLEQERFDLTVVGSHGYGPVMRVLLGSTSEHVLTHAPTSVLIVPQRDHV
jgi:nucleotide-binding universal stress UspA family protein